MPFDANGNFSLVPGTIVADGMDILPSQHNPPFLDVAAGLSMAMVRDGRAPWTGDQNANEFKVTNIGPATQPGDAVNLQQLNDAVSGGSDISIMFWLASTL